jgi:uncharacterized protein YecE (DUF72 family)
MSGKLSQIHIGAQGWNYDDWVGSFYPRGTRAVDYLDLYTRVFDTVEIDSSFYAIPSENSMRSWRDRAPDGFTYSLKLPQEITHRQRLFGCQEILKEFCERAGCLGEKLASILIQLPPDFSPRSWNALENFLPLLPREMKFAVELRDRSWLSDEVIERLLGLLAEHRVALALADSKWVPGELSINLIDRPTAPFAYVRWLGPRVLTEFSRIQINRDRELSAWAEGLQALRQRVDVIYGYFNNHYQGHSPASCNQLKVLIGQTVIEPDSLITQPSLF